MEKVVEQLLSIAKLALPLVGPQALDQAERWLTIPEEKVRELCKGMSEEDTTHAVELSREMADKASDFIVFVASRGGIQEDN